MRPTLTHAFHAGVWALLSLIPPSTALNVLNQLLFAHLIKWQVLFFIFKVRRRSSLRLLAGWMVIDSVVIIHALALLEGSLGLASHHLDTGLIVLILHGLLHIAKYWRFVGLPLL